MDKRRLGDNAEIAYIELTGNDLEKYEKAITEEKVNICLNLRLNSILKNIGQSF